MTNLKIKYLWITPLIPIIACSNNTEVKTLPTNNVAQQSSSCPIIESGKWHSWLDRHDQPENSYRLQVSGEVLLPNPAYDFTWAEGPTDRMYPPEIRLYLTPIARDEMVIQVLTPMPIKYEMSTLITNYRHVSIYCEGKLLTQITDIKLTD
jgi:hypothetical protein